MGGHREVEGVGVRLRALAPWAAGGLVLAAVLAPLDQPDARFAADSVNAAGLLVATAVITRWALRRSGRLRLVTSVFAAAVTALAAARLLSLLRFSEFGAHVPQVLPAVASGVGAVLFAVGLLGLFRREEAPASARAVAEASLITVLAALLAIAVGLSGLDDPRLAEREAFVVALFWAVVAAPLAALALGALASPRRRQPAATAQGLGAVACYTSANAAAAALLLRGVDHAQVYPLEGMALLATGLLVGSSGALADRPRPEAPVRTVAALAPLALCALLAAGVVLCWTGRPPSPVEAGLALLAAGLGLVRQVAADRDAAALQHGFHHQARTDALTGLANRARLLERAQEAGREAALVLVDLDGFKQVNDTSGHVAGDRVLVEVATRLRGAVGPGGSVARLGGDEFALLLDDARQARAVTDRVVDALEEPFDVDGCPVALSASAGVALCADDPDAATLLDQADVAMYASKNAADGRRTTWWSEALGTEVLAQERLRRDLRAQLLGDAEQLSVVHQPVLDLADGRVTGAEALVRWHHPELGPVSPGVFVPLVEAEGLSRQLSDRVLELACADAARWQAAGHDVRLAVNLCGHELVDDLPERLLAALGRHGLRAGSLVLELTERTLVDAGERTVALLRRIHDLGPRVALDDFGAGFSALAYLSRLPLQIIKLDRSLVAGLHADRGAAVVVQAVLGLAEQLGLQVVAEGVEVADELEALRRLGCPAAQGYHLGRPAPADDLLARLDADRARRQADVSAAVPRQVDRSLV